MESSPSQDVKPSRYHPKYRPDIDGLRALAVVSVVAYHASPEYFAGGFIGVDIFFVISGYLISGIIYGSVTQNHFSLLDFYERRVNRIFPALLLVLASCYAFGWLTLFPVEFEQLGKHLTGGATFISNILLWDESGYFDTAAEVKPLLHLWSLGIEEQFYIFWPIIIWAAHKLRVNLLIAALLLATVSFATNLLYIGSDASYVFYMPHTRAWELLFGSVLAHYTYFNQTSSAERPRLRNLMSVSGLLLIASGLYFITSEKAFPGWWALIPVTGSALLIAGGPDAWINKNIFSFRPFVWIGLISFPLYLWHWPLLSFARIIESGTPPIEMRLAAVALSILLAIGTYRIIETPLRGVKAKAKPLVLAGLMLVTGVVGFITYLKDGIPNRESVKSAEEFNAQFVGPLWKFTTNEICLEKYPYERAKDFGWWFCVANKKAAPTVLLLGTSYANHLYPGLASHNEIGKNSILSIGACSPEAYVLPKPIPPTTTHPCSGDRPALEREFVNQIIEESGTVKYAIINGISDRISPERANHFSRRISELEAAGIQVILFVPHVRVNYDLKGCFTRPLQSNSAACMLETSEREKVNESFSKLSAVILAKHPSVKIFDQNEMFCSEQGCSLTLNGMPIFRDQYGHLSEYASGELAKRFAQWAKENAPGLLAAD